MSISIDYDLCENTGACVAVCPEDVLEQENGHTLVVNSQACISCWICVDSCISGAIEID